MFEKEPCPGCQPDAPLELRIPCGNYLGHEVSVCHWCGVVKPLGDNPQGIRSWCSEAHREAHQAATPDFDCWKGWEPIGDVLPGGRLDGALEEIGLTTVPACTRCGYPESAMRHKMGRCTFESVRYNG